MFTAQSKSLFFTLKNTFHRKKVTKSDAADHRATFGNSFANFPTIFVTIFTQNRFHPSVTSQTAHSPNWKPFFFSRSKRTTFPQIFNHYSANNLENFTVNYFSNKVPAQKDCTRPFEFPSGKTPNNGEERHFQLN